MVFTIVCDVLGEENNGTVIATMNLIRALAKKNHQVRVVSMYEKEYIENVTWYVVGQAHFGAFIDKIIDKNKVEIAKGDKRVLASAIKGADCVHIEFPLFLGRLAIKIANNLNIPITASFHCQAQNVSAHLGPLVKSRRLNKKIYKNFYNHAYKKVQAIHYPTEFIKEEFEGSIKKQTNGYVISNGVRDDVIKKVVLKPKKLQDKFVIMTTGRLCGEKNQKTLIKAIGLSENKESIHLIMAGAGPDKEKLEALCKKYNISYEVGFYNHNELIDTMNMVDLYVHPANYELEGIACLEAIALGKPTLVSNSKKSATRFFAVDPYAVFKHNRPKDLAVKIDYYYNHQDKLKELGDKYYANNSVYSLDFVMDKMEKMLIETSKINLCKKVIYYKDKLNDDFANNHIDDKPTDDNYNYKRGPLFKFFSFIFKNLMVKFIALLYVKIVYSHSVKNKKALKDAKKNGAYMYYNHTGFAYDAFIPNVVPYFKDNYIIVGYQTMNIKPLTSTVKALGAIPIGYSSKSYKNMYKELKDISMHNHLISIYPEAHIWPFYNDIRPFVSDSFNYPVSFNKPVYAMTNCFSKRKGKKLPKITTYVDGPFYLKPELSKKENITYLRDCCYNAMKKRSLENSNYEYYRYVYEEK